MYNLSFLVAVALRQGIKCCQQHNCSLCGKEVSQYGTHGLSCKKSAGRHSRHYEVNALLSRALQTAGFPNRLEPAGLFRNDGKRPDGLTLTPWANGKSMIWDFTCVDTLASSYLRLSTSGPGNAAAAAETKKRAKYTSLDSQYIVCPVAVETFGAWGPESFQIVQKIGREIQRVAAEPKTVQYLLQRISVSIQRGNASSVFATLPSGASLSEVFYM